MYNKVMILGNLTRDIELRYITNGLAIAKSAIASNRKYKEKEEVMYIDITFFGRSAEIANQYLHRGSKVLIEGRLQLEQWTDQNGQKRSKHSVVVESMQMVDSKATNIGREQTVDHAHHADHATKPRAAPVNTIPEIDIDEDDIPF